VIVALETAVFFWNGTMRRRYEILDLHGDLASGFHVRVSASWRGAAFEQEHIESHDAESWQQLIVAHANDEMETA
jgi:hypothetical protein